ncbi:MAG: peptidase MA family metallohydrolase, partial [bacterium]|nr:peptidase MA family metallohydrolase [bacterium]
IELTDSVYFFMAPTESDYLNHVGSSIPNWSSGVAFPDQRRIVLKSPRTSNQPNAPFKTAVHELAHIMLHSNIDGRAIPRWFDEGIAVYFSGEKMYASGSLVSKAVISKSLIDLMEIDRVLKFHQDKARLAYQQSYLAVRYLFEQYGAEQVKKLVQQLRQGNDLDQAMLNTIGMDMADFEYEWYHHIRHKYRWHFLMDFDYYLWIIILGLFILGFILIRRRNRKTIKRWEQENDWDEPWSDTDSSTI